MPPVDTNNPTKTPLYDQHLQLGGRMASFAGVYLPLNFKAGALAEHRWTRSHASLFDVSHMGQVVLAGHNVDRAIETLIPSDIQGLGIKQMRYSMLLNDKGGVCDDIIVTRHSAHELFLVINGAYKDEDLRLLREKLPSDIEITLVDDRALLALQGPRASHVLGSIIPDIERLVFMRAENFPYKSHELLISRSGYTGEDGFEISIPNDIVEEFYKSLLTHPDTAPAGLAARDSLRLEAGLPLCGNELSPEITPIEAGLQFVVSKARYKRADFPGASIILDQIVSGPGRIRLGLVAEGRYIIRSGCEILTEDGTATGRITSGVFSPTLDRPIALGLVQAQSKDKPLHAVVRGKRVELQRTKLPFVPHKYVR